MLRISPYSVRMRDNTDLNNYECKHFLRSDIIDHTVMDGDKFRELTTYFS